MYYDRKMVDAPLICIIGVENLTRLEKQDLHKRSYYIEEVRNIIKDFNPWRWGAILVIFGI
jgi:hypothetical protein